MRRTALPVPAEIDAGLVVHRQRHDPVNLGAVRVFAVILPPRALLREADQVGASNVMMVADLAAPHAGEERLGGIRVDIELTTEAVCLLMIDAVKLETGV